MTNPNTRPSLPPNIVTKSRIMSDSLRPIWCIQRSEDTYVPLIAIDELPESVRLVGVPSTMTMKEMVNAGLACKGEQNSHGKCYLVEPSESDTSSETSHSSHSFSEGTITPPKKASVAPDLNAAVAKAVESGKEAVKTPKPDEVQANIANITANPNDIPFVLRPTATPGTLGKKVYCTYFLNTGNCNYMQEGCKYKHEFPSDEETRNAIGLRKLPTWMRDDPAVPIKPLVPLSQQNGAPAFQQNWRSRAGSRTPQAELGTSAKPLASTPFSPVGGRTHTMPHNATTGRGPFIQPQTANHHNHAQQLPLFGPPNNHFPGRVNQDSQQQSHPQSGTFGNFNGHGHSSPAVISADSFNRQIPANGVHGSRTQHAPSINHPHQSSQTPQTSIGHSASIAQSFVPDARISDQQQTNGQGNTGNGSTYNYAAPDARVRNVAVYTPSHTSDGQTAVTGSTAPLSNVNGNSLDNSNHHAQDYHYVAGLPSNGTSATHSNGDASAAFAFRAPTSAAHDPQPLMANDIHQLNLSTQPLTPSPFDGATAIAQANAQANDTDHSNASQTDPGSPAYVHPRMFVQEGEPRFVTNSSSKATRSPAKDGHKKAARKAPSSSGGKRGHKGRGAAQYSETLI